MTKLILKEHMWYGYCFIFCKSKKVGDSVTVYHGKKVKVLTFRCIWCRKITGRFVYQKGMLLPTSDENEV